MSTFLANEDVTGPSFLTCTSFSTVQSSIGPFTKQIYY
jgi:hypothetical protein